MRRRSLLAAPALALPAAAALAQGEAYPSRPVRMIVPFAAGGAADVVARLTAQAMSETLGQPIVVENRGGSGGVIGSEAALAAPADGYTVVFHTLSSAGLYRSLTYDVRRAFAPVALIGLVPNVVLVNARVPANTLGELIALLKREPGKHSYASSGSGTITHLSGHLLLAKTGTEAVHVPYRGSGPALTDLMSGTVEMMVDTLPGVLPGVRGGQLRALAVTTRQRSPALPEVPTTAEAGLPGYETYNWHGVFAPAAVPAPVQARLEQAALAALNAPATQRRLADVGVDPRPLGAQEFGAFWDEQLALWIPIIRSSGATAD
jgi:tripartite-type tricarboxylate transporter receptor subunit TctC